MSIAHFDEAFHGRSGYTLSITNTDPIKTDRFVKFDWPCIPNPKIRFPLDGEEKQRLENAEKESLEALRSAAEAAPDEIAGVIIEPIQGEGGDNHFRESYLLDLERTTHDIGALFIVDEVQTGVGATGKMWAYEHTSVKPDMLAFGKKMQVCGMMAGERLLEHADNVFSTSSRINSTWGGNLVDMVRGAAILEVIDRDGLLQNATQRGAEILTGLNELANTHSDITNVRGQGLLAAFSLASTDIRNQFREQALKDGMLLLNSGADSIRLRPPLTLSTDEVDQALNIFESTIKRTTATQVA
jgi:L-lysine 6-transaminase